jgi:hypothetical protein
MPPSNTSHRLTSSGVRHEQDQGQDLAAGTNETSGMEVEPALALGSKAWPHRVAQDTTGAKIHARGFGVLTCG